MASNLHNYSFKYTPLTTASTAQEFQSDLSRQYEIMRNMSQTLPGVHKTQWNGGRGGSYSQNVYPPDHDAFYVGFSMVLSMLNRIVQTIKETDDTLQALIDDSDDEEDILHASGELFAAKTVYVNLVASIEPLETSRVRGSREGVGAKEYFNLVHSVGDIPNVVPSATYGSALYGNGMLNTVPRLSTAPRQPNFFMQKAVSPSVSATPPKVPLLP